MTTPRQPLITVILLAFTLCCGLVVFRSAAAIAQAPASDPAGASAIEIPDDVAVPGGEPIAPAVEPPALVQTEKLNLWELLIAGGFFMIPIGLFSLAVVTFSIERAIGLRRNKVLPKALMEELGRLSSSQGGFDPRKAYKLCQQYPSAASSVIRAMLLKVGRPHSEVEHSVQESSEREATRLYGNVRWLNLAATVTPLLGLLGTVWGMIDAFHATTVLPEGANKADHLASGIYVALVTTLGGLCVAIPAAVMSHYFEGRIQNLFHQIDELLFNLLPQIERYEGRIRFSRHFGDNEAEPRSATESQLTEETAAK